LWTDAKLAWKHFLKKVQAKYYRLTMVLVREEVPEKRDQRGRPRITD
jgi:hypothetical protein